MRLKLKIPLIVLIALSIIVPLGYAGANVYLKYNPPVSDESPEQTEPSSDTETENNLEKEGE